jgi:hypothetical protein
MTEKELKERVNVRWAGYGTYKVTINYRGKEYTCTSHNAPAYDMLDDHDTRGAYYTSKGAYQSFWDECKRKNNLI